MLLRRERSKHLPPSPRPPNQAPTRPGLRSGTLRLPQLCTDRAQPASGSHVPAVTLGELVDGLEHALTQQLTLAVAEAVDVDVAAAGVDIAPRLLEARGRGGGRWWTCFACPECARC